MQFLATTGESYQGTVESVTGETVVIRYPESRSDTPLLATPKLTFQVGGTLGDRLRSAVANYNRPGTTAPSLGQLLTDLAEPLGVSFSDATYDRPSGVLRITPVFTPRPIQYVTRLDLGDKIAGIEFNANGDFLVSAAPTIRLPWRSTSPTITRSPWVTASPSRWILHRSQPGHYCATGQSVCPRIVGPVERHIDRRSCDHDNDGVRIQTTFNLNVNDPNTAPGTTGKATISELIDPANLTSSFTPSASGLWISMGC